MKQAQHGDILIREIERIPEGAKQTKRNGRLILAEGEATGHHHAITDKGATIWLLERNGIQEMYLEIAADQVTLTHEEHKAIDIPQGVYQIGRVKEYDYLQDMERQVVD